MLPALEFVWNGVTSIPGPVMSFLTGFVGWILGARLQSRQVKARKQVAEMKIATQLRAWLSRVDEDLDYSQLSFDSGGAGGKTMTELPPFAFEASLDDVALLDPSSAKSLFDLIFGREQVHSGVRSIIEFHFDGDPEWDEPTKYLVAHGSQLWAQAADEYNKLASVLGWAKKDGSSERRAYAEKYEADRRKEAQSQRVDLNWE